MLDATVGHFRIFQETSLQENEWNEHDFWSLLPKYVSKRSTDHHLKECAELESHMKRYRQLIHSNLDESNTITAILDSSVIGCLEFYSRLLTVDTFTWPDFLGAIYAKAVEQFVNTSSIHVKKCILQLFQRSRAHISQVHDSTKLRGYLKQAIASFNRADSTTIQHEMQNYIFTLRLLATMPTLLQHDTYIQSELLLHLDNSLPEVRLATIGVIHSLLPYMPSLQTAIEHQILHMYNSSNHSMVPLLCVLPRTFSKTQSNPQTMEFLWKKCMEAYQNSTSIKETLLIARSATVLAVTLCPNQLLKHWTYFVRRELSNNPREVLKVSILMAAKHEFQQYNVSILSSDEKNIFRDFIAELLNFINEDKTSKYIHLEIAAWRFICVLTNIHGSFSAIFTSSDSVHSVTALIEARMGELLRSSFPIGEILGTLYCEILSNIITDDLRQNIAVEGTVPPHFEILVGLLQHNSIPRDSKLWSTILLHINTLAQKFRLVLAPYACQNLTSFWLQLAESRDVVSKLLLNSISHAITFESMAYLQSHFSEFVQALENENTKSDECVAIAVILLRSFPDPSEERDEIYSISNAIVNRFLKNSSAEMFTVARLAMEHAHYNIATRILTHLTTLSSNRRHDECFRNWLFTLLSLSRGEGDIIKTKKLSTDHMYAISKSKSHIISACNEKYSFAFQIAWISLRITWFQLLQNALQIAGEEAFCGEIENSSTMLRKNSLVHQFIALGNRYIEFRRRMYEASTYDLELIIIFCRLCFLMANAVEAFILHIKPTPIPSTRIGFNNDYMGEQSIYLGNTCNALQQEIDLKSTQLKKITTFRQRHIVGAAILSQLVKVISLMPVPVPRIFFRSCTRSNARIISNIQFLTHSERWNYIGKPRSRTEIGVSLGTNFSCYLMGVVAREKSNRIFPPNAESKVRIQLIVIPSSQQKLTAKEYVAREWLSIADGNVGFKEKECEELFELELDLIECSSREYNQEWTNSECGNDELLYAKFESPVSIPAKAIGAKGSYVLMAIVDLVDNGYENWRLHLSGGRRGFIVY